MKTIYSSLMTSIAAAMAAAMTLITPAHAEAAAGQDSGFASLIPLILIMVIFYFLLIRPQQKKLKQHRQVVDELKKGDKVLTGGGIYGKVIDVKDDILKVEIAEGIRIKVKRDTVAGLAEENAPVKKEKTSKSAKNKDKDSSDT